MEGTKEPESSGVPALKIQKNGGFRTGTVGNYILKLCFDYASHDVTSHLRVMLDHPYGPMVERPVTPS